MSDATFHLAAPVVVRPASPRLTRAALLAAVAAGVAAGFVAADGSETARAVAASGEELTRLLRFMALVKSAMALATVAAVLWRFKSPASVTTVAAYALACCAMASGPGLIWNMDHVGLGALLLHGGLAACLVLLWRDPAVAARLSAAVATRRRASGLRPVDAGGAAADRTA